MEKMSREANEEECTSGKRELSREGRIGWPWFVHIFAVIPFQRERATSRDGFRGGSGGLIGRRE